MKNIDFISDLLPLKNKLFRLALRITLDPIEAEDVVEDVLVKVWERREQLAEVENIAAYCTTTCRRLALDRAAKQEAQNLSLEVVPTETADTAALPDEKMEQDERLQLVGQLFNRLPEKQRTALQLRDIEGHSYQEVAEQMQITEADVKVTIYRARQSLKQQIEALRGQF